MRVYLCMYACMYICICAYRHIGMCVKYLYIMYICINVYVYVRMCGYDTCGSPNTAQYGSAFFERRQSRSLGWDTTKR